MKHSMTKKIFSVAVSGLWLALIFSQIAFGAQEPKAKNLDTALTQTAVTAQESNIKDPDAALTPTAFTYQGQLKDANGPVNGSFDFQFTLYSTQTGGEDLGANEIEEAVLSNGMFRFKLDFGRTAVEAKESWLEIGVRPSGSLQDYTVLFPRQKLTPTPYAIFAQHEQWSLIGVPVGFVDLGIIQEGTTVTRDVDTVTRSKDETTLTAENNAAAPQGTPNVIAKFDGNGNPTANSIMFDNGANVGIGTTAPDTRLNVNSIAPNSQAVLTVSNGNADTRLALWSGFGAGANPPAILYTHDLRFGTVAAPNFAPGAGFAEAMRVTRGGNVGIGTINPTSRLEIVGQDGLAITGYQPFLTLRDANAGGKRSFIQGVNGDLVFIPQSFQNRGAAMVIRDGDGLVSIRILQILGGSDLSEKFDVTSSETLSRDASPADVQPGMVVAIDPESPGKLVVSHQAYDRRVAGIVSGAGGVKPGMMMGQEGTLADGQQPVALSGRVYCWAEASNGPIEPGDLLTTSDTPGHAMKVTNHKKAQGAIIGKAMTELKQGKGLVLVLVTLQ